MRPACLDAVLPRTGPLSRCLHGARNRTGVLSIRSTAVARPDLKLIWARTFHVSSTHMYWSPALRAVRAKVIQMFLADGPFLASRWARETGVFIEPRAKNLCRSFFWPYAYLPRSSRRAVARASDTLFSGTTLRRRRGLEITYTSDPVRCTSKPRACSACPSTTDDRDSFRAALQRFPLAYTRPP